MSLSRISIAVGVVLAVTAGVFASETDELRQRAQSLVREADELQELGRAEEAEDLLRQAQMFLKEADVIEGRERALRPVEIDELERRLQMLRREQEELAASDGSEDRLNEVNRAIDEVVERLHDLHHGAHRERAAAPAELGERLEHMHAAIEHLHRAGLPDVAELVHERAEAAEREMRQRRQHQPDDRLGEILHQLDEMRREVGRLRVELNEIKEQR